MQLLYSGAASCNNAQIDPEKSLGGYASSTPIPNGALNNVFPPISRAIVVNNTSATRLIVVVNNSFTVNNLKIWTVAGNLSTYQIAAVSPATDTKGNPVFETIYSSDSIPYQAVLASQEGIDNAITVASLAANDMIGIWIKRNLNLDNFTQLDGLPIDPNITDANLATLIIATDANPLDLGQLFISWD